MSLLGEDIGTPLALVDRALALNPGYATAWFWSGFIKLFAGSTDVAIEHFQTSLRLDPRTTLRPFTDTGIWLLLFAATPVRRGGHVAGGIAAAGSDLCPHGVGACILLCAHGSVG